jgi:hypothetical protein
MREYYGAAVCRRGHVETGMMDDPSRVSPRCDECGARVITNCQQCDAPIRGLIRGGTWTGYDPPEFCFACGSPHPWASRQSRFYELENLLDEQNLDPADELKVRDELEALRSEPSADEKTELRRWETIQKYAPGLMQAGERIIESVVTAAIKAHLGI